MYEREEIEVDRIIKQKWTCRDAVWAAFIRLEQRTGRVEFHLAQVVSEVWAATHRYTKGTIETEICSRMCTNAPINHAVRTHDLERVGPDLYRRCAAPPSPRALPDRDTWMVARDFHFALLRLLDRCERELHFTPTWLRKMLPRVGGVETARRLVCSKATEEDLDKFWRAGCLDESVEALMLDPHFARLFTDAQPRTYRPWSEIEAQYRD